MTASLVRGLAVILGILIAAAAPPAGAAVFGPTSFTLDNGMQVVVVENHRAPVVVHMVWYRVGAADEPPGQSGVAHFLEHLMFKGTDKVPAGEFSKIIARNGGRDNAFTADDYTGYFQMVAADKLDLVMGMEADRMVNLKLAERDVIAERDVVREERRARTENNPGAQLGEAMGAALYLAHPYRNPVIGWAHEIESLNREDALAFYRQYYAPNNAILIVAGDVTPDAVRQLAEKHYGPIPPGDVAPRKRVAEPPHMAARLVTLKSPRVRQPSWSRYYLAPSYGANAGPAPYALAVLSEILGGGATSRLHRRLVVEQKLAASAGSWYGGDGLDYSNFALSATPRPGVEIAALQAAIEAEIARVIESGISADELARAKRTLRAGAVYARDSLSAAPNIIGRALTSGRTVEDVESWPDRLAQITADQVRDVAREVLDIRRSVTGLLLPEAAK